MGDDKRFWDIIDVACAAGASGDFTSRWWVSLVAQLKTLAHEDIARYERWFGEKVDALETDDLLGAANEINGGVSDDGFYHFRCSVVGMGKAVYESAMKDADSLADLVSRPGMRYPPHLISGAWRAWGELGLGESEFERSLDALGQKEPRLFSPISWDVDSPAERRRRLPRLSAICRPDETD